VLTGSANQSVSGRLSADRPVPAWNHQNRCTFDEATLDIGNDIRSLSDFKRTQRNCSRPQETLVLTITESQT
jgi:hypothetical protein